MRRITILCAIGAITMVAMTIGCAEKKPTGDTAIQDVKDAPKWITNKGAAFSGDRRVLYGVGSSTGIATSTLRRRAAEARAREDIALTLQVYVAGLQKQFVAETTAGSMDKKSVEQHIQDTMKQVTNATLVGVEIIEYWEYRPGQEAYALARLDTERIMKVMEGMTSASSQYKELDEKMREFVRKNSDKAHDELNQELQKQKQS
jgi:LPP20 lipoprotein